MLYLVPIMLEKVGIIVIVAFLLSQMKSFRQIVQYNNQNNEKIMLILLFGSFGVISNFTGIEVFPESYDRAKWFQDLDPDSALANTRVLGTVIGGLLGGPIVGVGAGIIAGIHRYTLGGFTAFACSISTVIAGIVAGFLGIKRKKQGKKIDATFAVIVGMSLEVLQMLIILLAAKPFDLAWNLVQVIAVPMIFVNGFGMMLFLFIIQYIKREQERTRANQTNKAFLIADQTLPHFRSGLNFQSSKAIAEIILKLTRTDAVAITDESRVLAHVGKASDHHITGEKPETDLTWKVLRNGKISIAKTKKEISCLHDDCPLEAAIVMPLKVNGNTVGTLKMYYTSPEKLDKVERQLAEGLAKLFSNQLDLASAEKQAELLKDAEIKALQAQVHPHFLFNSINTISALCRTDPMKARQLLLQLSSFFRGNLQGARQMLIPLEKELENVKAYMELEQSRFPNKFHIEYDIEQNLEDVLIPPFILQPLVENAVNYGFVKSKKEGRIIVQIKSKNDQMQIIVSDNGNGIPEEKITVLGKQVVQSKKGNGTAIFNISERLKGIYNGLAKLEIKSKAGLGTKILISIPLDEKGVLEQDAKSVYCG